MANEIIHRSTISELQVSTLILADKTGVGPSTVSSPSGTAYQILGDRRGFENHTTSYSIPQNSSGFVWTNTGAGSAIVYTLPSGALIGTLAHFIRTGASVSITPDSNSRIMIPESGFFRANGISAVLASSGARLAITSDGSNNWYPFFQIGTIQ